MAIGESVTRLATIAALTLAASNLLDGHGGALQPLGNRGRAQAVVGQPLDLGAVNGSRTATLATRFEGQPHIGDQLTAVGISEQLSQQQAQVAWHGLFRLREYGAGHTHIADDSNAAVYAGAFAILDESLCDREKFGMAVDGGNDRTRRMSIAEHKRKWHAAGIDTIDAPLLNSPDASCSWRNAELHVSLQKSPRAAKRDSGVPDHGTVVNTNYLGFVSETVGDYTQIASLRYSSVPTVPLISSHYAPACQFCNVMKVQSYLRDGIDGEPLSPQFLMDVVAQSDGLGGQITATHGFTSPLLGWQFAHDVGSCPASLCPPLRYRVTTAMREAALPYRVGSFLTLADVPDYPSAVAYLAANHGAAVILSTDGYRCYSIIGLDGDGNGLWLDYPKPGPPVVLHLSEQDGAALWWDQIGGNSFPPEHYMVVVNVR